MSLFLVRILKRALLMFTPVLIRTYARSVLNVEPELNFLTYNTFQQSHSLVTFGA